MKKKKPDQVVWDEAQEEYMAKLLPYASQVSGPIIEVPNVDAFKKKGVDKVSKQFQTELADLQKKLKHSSNKLAIPKKFILLSSSSSLLLVRRIFYTKGKKKTIYH